AEATRPVHLLDRDSRMEEQVWSRPDIEFVKLNFDSGQTTNKGTGFGGIIRD
ncbi:hypothetical protein M569_10390, partial [Genlisea aurea]